jgi:hypothetical protein
MDSPGLPQHGSSEKLSRNLRALGSRSGAAVDAIRRASAPEHVILETAPDGGLTGSIHAGGAWRRLASARGPVAEGEALASGVDVVAHAAVVVMGFGVGHHVSALARRMKGQGAIIVFEPDAGLLRAVFERVDCSAWLAQGVVIVTQADDAGALASATQGIEAVLASGTKILDHPSSRARLGLLRDRFAATLAQVMKAIRTNIVTTLVQVDITVRNLMHNARAYVESPGVADLRGIGAGRAAVVVSAGPSLRRNVDLLGDKHVRGGVVVIAVQTVLKTLLARGIRPDYVTALDYHEISARFYEGLSPEDVRGITLVVEPKCNPAIVAAWPGEIRCVGDETLDRILGERFAHEKGMLPPGATVAHLAYYLARHLGCDPVILIGQDLGFTDGLYYGPGAAIHNVWAGELNEFNTLEMLEWQRIARMASLLRRCEDVNGRAIYTDEQMSTYLVQFERDFRRDAERGLTVIDATEGGVRKSHTTVMPLREALRRFGGRDAPSRPPARRAGDRAGAAIERRFQELRRSVLRVEEESRRARGLLVQMLEHQHDQARVNRLIEEVTRMAERVAAEDGYWLVQHVNQAGQLNRYRTDRAIEVGGLEGLARQRQEIERDIRNVEWLADAGEGVGRMLEEAIASLRTGKPATRESTPIVRVRPQRKRVWACVTVDHEFGALGVRRDLARPFLAGMNPMRLLLTRLARCSRLEGIVLLCRDVERARGIAGSVPPGARVEFERWRGTHAPRMAPGGTRRASRVAGGRAWARHCWRGGIGGLSVFDEALDAGALRDAVRLRDMDAVILLGADWALVDPVLTDALVERHEERPEGQPMTFTQAAPGLCGCLLSRALVEEIARVPDATVGGVLGYHPAAPQGDPIAKPACVGVPVAVRDLLVRCIPDTARNIARLGEALAPLGQRVVEVGAEELASHLHSLRTDGPVEAIEVRAHPLADRRELIELMRMAIAGGDAPAVSIIGDGCDVLDVPGVAEIIGAARAYGAAAVHLRTRLDRAGAAERHALRLADVVSVDLLAEDAGTYRSLTGRDVFEVVKAELARLVGATRASSGAAGDGESARVGDLWVVPRITRRDEVLEQIEPFYTRWLVACGACVIDPRTDAPEGARAEALPLPARAAERLSWSRAVVSLRPVEEAVA